MKTINAEVRERILKSYDQPGRTRTEVAAWFGVFPRPEPHRENVSKVKTSLRSAKARTPAALAQAIAQAMESITARDAANWFASCGYAIY